MKSPKNLLSLWSFVQRKVTWGAKPHLQPRILQESISITASGVRGLCITWGVLYVALAFTSDLSKSEPKLWMAYRLSVASILIAARYLLGRNKNSARHSGKVGLALGLFMAAAYTASGYSGLPMRTTWIAVFLSSFIGMSCGSLLSGVLTTSVFSAACLFAWSQPTLLTWMISDSVFGLFILAICVIGRRLWLLKTMSDLELEEKLKDDIQKQMRVYSEIKRFIPPVLSFRIESKLSSGVPLEDSIHDVLIKKHGDVAILYSDMRNYSLRSDCIDFIENELMQSSEPIILQCEGNMGVARQIGDAILVFYGYETGHLNLLRAVTDASISSMKEWNRTASKEKKTLERYFTVTYGKAYVGDVGNSDHHEVTVTGKPANLSARIDELTKEQVLLSKLQAFPVVLLSEAAFSEIKDTAHIEFEEVNLGQLGLKIRTYTDENKIFLLKPNDLFIATLKRILKTANDTQQLGVKDVA